MTISMPSIAMPMLDEAWVSMVQSFRSAENPAKWKAQVVSEQGQVCNVRHVAGRFVRKHHGQLAQLVPHSYLTERRGRIKFIGTLDDGTAESFDRRCAELRTGNHQPKKHPVRVPTSPGQPVRG